MYIRLTPICDAGAEVGRLIVVLATDPAGVVLTLLPADPAGVVLTLIPADLTLLDVAADYSDQRSFLTHTSICEGHDQFVSYLRLYVFMSWIISQGADHAIVNSSVK